MCALLYIFLFWMQLFNSRNRCYMSKCGQVQFQYYGFINSYVTSSKVRYVQQFQRGTKCTYTFADSHYN